jgi:hypothetical protein
MTGEDSYLKAVEGYFPTLEHVMETTTEQAAAEIEPAQGSRRIGVDEIAQP